MCVRPDGLPVVECMRCGLAYLSPRPRPPFVSRLYGRDYFVKEGDSAQAIGYSDYLGGFARKVALARLDLLERLRPLKGTRVLEIGCATGDLLAEMRNRGAVVTGLDVSSWAAETTRRRHGIDVLVGSLDTLDNTLAQFDIILALEVIEHVENPKEFLWQLGSHLAPGGYGLISTPNYRCARRFGSRWVGFQRSFEHLYFLSDDVLSRMAAAADLQEVVWYGSGHGLLPKRSAKGIRARARRFAKKLPGAVHVWSLVRRATAETRHVPYGQGHSLAAVFRKHPLTITGGNEGTKSS